MDPIVRPALFVPLVKILNYLTRFVCSLFQFYFYIERSFCPAQTPQQILPTPQLVELMLAFYAEPTAQPNSRWLLSSPSDRAAFLVE